MLMPIFVYSSLYCAVKPCGRKLNGVRKHAASYWDARTPARNWRLSQSQLRKI